MFKFFFIWISIKTQTSNYDILMYFIFFNCHWLEYKSVININFQKIKTCTVFRWRTKMIGIISKLRKIFVFQSPFTEFFHLFFVHSLPIKRITNILNVLLLITLTIIFRAIGTIMTRNKIVIFSVIVKLRKFLFFFVISRIRHCYFPLN